MIRSVIRNKNHGPNVQPINSHEIPGIRDMEQLFTKKEASEYLKVSTRTIDRRINDLDIPVYWIGRQVRIPESSLHLMLQKGMANVDSQKIVKKMLGD